MRHPLLAMRIYNQPHLMEAGKAEIIERVFARAQGVDIDVDAGEVVPKVSLSLTTIGAEQTKGRYYRTADGMAVIPVLGPLVQRGAAGVDPLCGGLESYESVGNQLAAAMADPLVKGVLLEIDSPGGEGAGAFDLAGKVRAASAQKPVIAHANEFAFSAAYALAAAAGELLVAPTGMVGSVGVILMHVDQSTYDEKRGIRFTPFIYGDRKNDFSPHEPLSDAAAQAAQNMVDRLGETFVAHVADARGIDADIVRGTQAGLLHADQALELGMADGATSLDGALTRLREIAANVGAKGIAYHRQAAAAASTTKGTAMDMKEQLAAAKAEGKAEGRAEVERETEAKAKAAASDAATAERARIKAIAGSEDAKGRESLAAHFAYETDMSAEAATAALKAAPAAAVAAPGNALALAMGKVANPNLGLDKGKGEETVDDVASRVLAAGKASGGLRAVK